MIRIALCDDNEYELNKVLQLVEECRNNFDERIEIRCFDNGEKLLFDTQKNYYDIIIIDVVMPEIYGTQVAKDIYKTNSLTQFIFLTSTRDFAVESYEVDALDYIIKPIEKERLNKAFDKFLKTRQKCETNELIIKGCGVTRIALNSLCYVEAMDHKLIYHMANGNNIAVRQNLAEIENFLMEHSCFIKPRRSFVVNMDYIDRIEQGCITMKNNDKIYASRANAKELPNLFLKYKFK